ncbi:DUF2637 domain-containing protein [Streptomyces sp. NPDC087294]|uniref:DUF2637 domain-containing protein n=1 Tax=Streptomyces sp. NPDC087294 TaxID=3365777 RepID=UPI003811E270
MNPLEPTGEEKGNRMDASASPSEQETEQVSSSRAKEWAQTRMLMKKARAETEDLDKWLDWLKTAGTYGLVFLGFSVSYKTIRSIAQKQGHFGYWLSNVVPLAFEGGIIVLSLHVIREARRGNRALLLRMIITACCAGTLVVNWGSVDTTSGKLTHVVPVGMFIICFEWLVHSSRTKALEDRGLLPTPLPRLRGIEWVLDFANSFARWRLMVLCNVKTAEEALWIRHELAVRKSELKEERGVRLWLSVPKHLRLRMHLNVLDDAKDAFSGGAPARHRPRSLPSTGLPAVPAPRANQNARDNRDQNARDNRELENPDEQTALPPGTRTATALIEGDVPYVSSATDLAALKPLAQDLNPEPRKHEMAHAAPPARSHPAEIQRTASLVTNLETGTERSQREAEDAHTAQTVAIQRVILDVIRDLSSADRPVDGPTIAEDSRVGVSARSVQRHMKRMKENGMLQEV